jgi:L-idonate 5-dehydrogenase
MKSVVCHSAKDLRIEDTELPALGENQLRVNVAYGGICGSDLHYYQHGGFGTVRIKQPIALGHEISGVVAQPLPEHAFLRQRHALPPHPGGLQ